MNPAHHLRLLTLGVLAVGLSSCQVLGMGGAETPVPSGTGVVAGAAETATAGVDLTAVSLSATPSSSPTPATPLPTPTSTLTPTATPTPIPPGPAVLPAASALGSKLAAFRTALAARNVDRVSAAQLALLDEADKAERAVQGDKSREANLVREAIEDIRGGAGGQAQLLDSAARLLNQVGGGGVSTSTAVAGQTSQDVATLAATLREQLKGYQQARRERNSENLLKHQRDLIVTLNEIAVATQGDNTPETKALRDAAASLRSALSSSGSPDSSGTASEQLTKALAEVQAAVGGFTENGQPDNQVTDISASSAALKRTATSFRSSLASGNRSETARLQRDLLDEIARAEAALKSNPDSSSTEAQNLQAAISSLRDGAAGDTAKLDSGLNRLGAAATTTGPESTGTVDVKKTADSLRSKLASLQRAIQNGEESEQLRLQRELYDEATKAEPLLQGDTSREADALRGAIGAIKSGVSGESGKLDEAERQLRAAGGLPTPAAPRSSLTPTVAPVDVGAATGSLEKRLSALQDALQKNDADATAKAEKELADEAERVAASLQGQRSADAERLRGAASAAREAARGDASKLDEALKTLRGPDGSDSTARPTPTIPAVP